MEEGKYLNEENYQKSKKKIIALSIVILVIGLLLGGSLIATGILKNINVDNKPSQEADIQTKLTEEENYLKGLKQSLENKGIKYDNFAKYTDGETYNLKVITNAMDPSFSYCSFDEYKNNSYTKKYCSLKAELADINDSFNRDFKKMDSIPLFMIGGFIIIASIMISLSIYSFAKRREIIAFGTQQVMPVVQEGVEKMAPTAGKVGKTIAKEMAPAYGEFAKEIAKGIKEGLNSDKKDN